MGVHRDLRGEEDLVFELGPTCENCNKLLPADSLQARIGGYECSFCATCVDTILLNVRPNCGGDFVSRPIRPSGNWKGDNHLGTDPASTRIRHKPIDPEAHARSAATIRTIRPEER